MPEVFFALMDLLGSSQGKRPHRGWKFSTNLAQAEKDRFRKGRVSAGYIGPEIRRQKRRFRVFSGGKFRLTI